MEEFEMFKWEENNVDPKSVNISGVFSSLTIKYEIEFRGYLAREKIVERDEIKELYRARTKYINDFLVHIEISLQFFTNDTSNPDIYFHTKIAGVDSKIINKEQTVIVNVKKITFHLR